ncbi:MULTISPECIES: protein-tyrosine-phosphatase [Flagellimonas]|uniref:Protein-tyrosine-phosphatase n=2 Tax=Flagellimonas TaxID=444459 RepID=A0A3A1NJI2_9FLAO|nr:MULTISPECIES: protein-tyrosine-phosphatase [Allomuricauda]RIV45220.1 protein-tyrosine-phosphatase [Allomuricauda maritima]TXJ96691.1 protein-tyrosine-phosphatase [Allomuricauda maritima]
MTTTTTSLFPEIAGFITTLKLDAVSPERREILDPLAGFIQSKVSEDQEIRLNFICTHNSRRSHLSQIWAQAMAFHFNIKNVFCYSGGTEATALFPMVAETLGKQGFQIQQLSQGQNPVYAIKYAENAHPVIGFSKKMDDAFNPSSGFGAIMTCDSANEACPFVPGAEKRIPITFEDPKAFDNTPQQAEKYLERSIQIATELWYVFSQIKS